MIFSRLSPTRYVLCLSTAARSRRGARTRSAHKRGGNKTNEGRMKVATRPMAVKPGADPIAQARLATSAIVSLSAEPRFARSLQRPANRGRSCRDRLARSRAVALNFVSRRVGQIDIVGDFNCNVYAQRVFYIEPTTTFTLDTSLNVVLMEVIGGAASWQGPLIGSSVVLLVAQFLRVTV